MNWFNQLTQLGSKQELAPDVKFLNGALIILLGLVFPYIGIFSFLGIYHAAISLLIGAGIYGIAIYASKIGKISFAKFLFITNWSLYITYFGALCEGVEGVSAFYIVSIGVAYLISNDKTIPIYAMVLNFAGFFFVMFEGFIPPLDLGEEGALMLNTFLYPSAFFVIYFIIKTFKTQILQQIEELKSKNELLAQSEEEIRVQSEELQIINEQLEEFTYIASHDLKTPIRGIHHYTQFLKEDFENELPEEAKEMITGIRNLSQKMNLLVDDVLGYSKAQRAELELKIFNLSDPIEVVKADLKDQPDIEIEILISEMPEVKSDIVGLKEAFYNFVTNAYKYNDSEKKTIEFRFDGGTKQLLITDNGIGIAKENHNKVFAFFKRIHGKDEYGGGTGAGMAIVKRILQRLGITIEIESEVGKGTTFKLDLSKVLV